MNPGPNDVAELDFALNRECRPNVELLVRDLASRDRRPGVVKVAHNVAENCVVVDDLIRLRENGSGLAVERPKHLSLVADFL